MGARQAITENQTTGSFLGHNYTLTEVVVPEDGDLVAAFKEALAGGERFFILDLHADQVLALADLPEAADALLFNTRAPDDRLRLDDCRANVFHIMPSRAMKADALAQYLVWKRWCEWFLIHGTLEPDCALAAALERAATKFGAEIVETREYEYVSTARRTDTGHVQIQSQIPVLTQDAPEHDVVVVADESDVFGEYLPYRTWDPRPVAGTQGLMPSAWHRSQEQWGGDPGAAPVREVRRPLDDRARLHRLARRAQPRRGGDPDQQRRSDRRSATICAATQFQIAAFKGEALSFRTWDQQLRQPILLVGPRMLVSVSPQDRLPAPAHAARHAGLRRAGAVAWVMATTSDPTEGANAH